MARALARRTIYAIGLVLAVGLAGLLMLAFFASQGPVPLPGLTAFTEGAIERRLSSGGVDIGEVRAGWVEGAGLRLAFRDVRFTDDAGRPTVRAPRLFVGLDARQLLRGRLRPLTVELAGLRLRLVRDDEGVRFGLAFAETAATDAYEGTFAALLEGLAGEEGGILAGLGRVVVSGAQIVMVDRVLDTRWVAPRADLAIMRDADRIVADADLAVATGENGSAGAAWPLTARAIYALDRRDIRINVDASAIVPAVLSARAPELEVLSALSLPVTFSAALLMDATGTLERATLSAQGGAGTVNAGAQAFAVERFDARLTYEPAARRFGIERFAVHGNDLAIGNVSGTVQLAEGEDPPVSFDLEIGETEAVVRGFLEGEALISAALSGRYEGLQETLTLERAVVSAAGGEIETAGTVRFMEDGTGVELAGTLNALPVPALLSIWPVTLADGARRWAAENVSAGTVDEGTFAVALAPGDTDLAGERGALPEGSIDFGFSFTGAQFSYVDGLPPIENAEGSGRLLSNTFETTVEEGEIAVGGDRLKVESGRFFVPSIHQKGGDGVIEVTTGGALSTVLALLDHEPLGYISEFGLDPAIASGEALVNATFTLPLVKDVAFSDVTFNARADVTGFGLPDVVGDFDLSGGTITLDVDRDGIAAEGTAAIGGVPAEIAWQERFDAGDAPSTTFTVVSDLDEGERAALGIGLEAFLKGEVPVRLVATGSGQEIDEAAIGADLTGAIVREETIGWWKPAGVPARLQTTLVPEDDGRLRLDAMTISGETLEVGGDLVLGPDGALLSAELPTVRLGEEHDLRLSIARGLAGELLISASGARLDARHLIDDLLYDRVREPEEEEDAEDEQTVIVEGSVATVAAHNDVELKNATGRFALFPDDVTHLDLSAELADGGSFNAEIAPAGPLTRRLSVTGTNAGSLLRGLDVYSSAYEGEVAIAATIDDGAEGHPMTGTVEVSEFRIVNAPVLANILTLGSFTGILDTLSGEGIRFRKLDLPFVMTEGDIVIDDAAMNGPAIGLTLKGHVDRRIDELDLAGTIVPAYTVNSMLGNIPLIGNLIVGREGEGIFAATFSVSGDLDDPSVVVNPLAALAPGFLRRLFEFGTDEPELETRSSVPTGSVNPPDTGGGGG